MAQFYLVAAIYVLVINLITWMLYWHDKRRAILGGRRVPEVRLLTFAALGGTPAARGAQRFYSHKTQKQPYRMYMQRITRWHWRLVNLCLAIVLIELVHRYLSSAV